MNHDSIVALLKSSVVFSVFGSEQLDDLISAGEVKSISAGDIFIREGAINPPPFVVLSGRLGMLKSAAGGKELTVEVLHPGDLFGLIAAFEQVPAPLTSQAQLDTTVFIVPKTMFLVLLEGHPSASLQFAEYISNRLQASYNFSGSIAHGPAQARFAAAIWELLPPASEQSSETIIQVTRQELAKSAGITVETAVRLAKAMEKEGILGLGQRKRLTVLDRERLRQIAFPQM